ncbi:MAG: hypothetical protein B7733_10875 [Myxococcales bacterium FL481]|nr:MAG: hypothetical protein B7733_10875 [Myxococcales bacterium FL481]
MRDPENKALRRLATPSGGWRGDEHQLRVAAAEEAGLDKQEAELEVFTEAFKASMVVEDPEDKAIVLRGRTVLDARQLSRSLRPTLRFLKLAENLVGLRVHDGTFELRVSAKAAETASPTLDSAKVALRVMVGFGVVGLMLTQVGQAAAAITWGVGLVVAGWVLRSGLVSGRAMLAARLAVSLAMLAQAEQLVLPLAGAGAPDGGAGGGS